MAQSSSGRVFIRLSSVINRELNRCAVQQQNPHRKSYFHCSGYQHTETQRNLPWNLRGNQFIASSWCIQNGTINRSFSGLPVESVKSSLKSESTQQPNKASEAIIKCIHEASGNNEDNIPSETCKQFSEQVQSMSDEEIFEVISLLSKVQSKGKYFADLFNSIDSECSHRAKSWEPRKALKILEKFNLVIPHFSSKFVKQTVLLWANNLANLNAQELLVFLLAVRRGRSFPQKLDRDLLEKRLSDFLEEFTLSELGIVCACFFESKQGIRNVQLIDRLVEKLVDNVDRMDERTIGSMLKLFRKSSFDSTNYSKGVLELQRTLLPHVTKWGPMVLIQLASVGTSLLYFDHSTIEKVTQKLMDCMQTARVKDLERLAMVTAIACHRTPTVQQFWDLVELELVKSERKDEIHQYAYSFISLVSYAIMSNVYTEKLVRMALDPEIVQSALGNLKIIYYKLEFMDLYLPIFNIAISENTDYNSTKRELLMLCCSLDIEHPNYDGPKLPAEELQRYEKVKCNKRLVELI